MALPHVPVINDGDLGSEIETKLDANFADLDTRVVTLETDTDVDALIFTPQATPPTPAEGQMYYDSPTGTMKIQGPFTGVEISVGHDMHVHVQNNSGALISKGTPVRHNGVVAGKIQVVPAIADSFDNARILGVIQADLPNASDGAAITFGEIPDLDTSGLTEGQPVYLSDTVAGGLTSTAPEIVTRVGGIVVTNATTGKLFVYVINNLSLPSVFYGLQGQNTPSYAVTTTAQDIVDYTTVDDLVMTGDPLLGTATLSNTGGYRMNFVADISFASATSTRELDFEFYNQTGATIVFPFIKNIPRDATRDGVFFSFPFNGTAGDVYKMRIKSNVAITVSIDNISFDIESVNIR